MAEQNITNPTGGEQKPKTPFIKDDAKREKYKEAWDRFETYRQEKEKNHRFFNKTGMDRNIYDYVKDSVDRMNEYHLKPEHKEPWQNNVFDPVTRDKVIAILSQLAKGRMQVELIVKSLSIFQMKKLEEKVSVFDDLLEAANRHNQDAEQLIWEMFTAMTEGTVIGYEGWSRGSRDVQYVTEYNPDTGEKKTQTMKHDQWDDVYGEIVPIEEFFPETVHVNANQFKRVVHRCFRARQMEPAAFKDNFGQFPGAGEVKGAGEYFDQTDFDWGIPNTLEQDHIFVLQSYDETIDKYQIWANGQELYDGCFPWNHKRLPFWIAIFEPIHHQFLFGKSMPDKLMGMQDIDNSTLNGMLDQILIGLKSPIFVDGEIDIDEGYLEPGKIIEIESGAKVQRGALGGVDPIVLQVLQLLRRGMEESSISAQAQGVPTGGRKTKFEVQQLQEGALNLASLFLQLMERSMTQKYLLRMYNVLQYYSMPSRKKTGKKQYKFIQVDNRTLPNGNKGTKFIQVVGGPTDIPGKEEIKKLSKDIEGVAFNEKETKVQPIFITTNYMTTRQLELEVEMVANSSVKDSEVQRANKNIIFYQAAKGDPGYNQEVIRERFAKALDQPKEVINKNKEQASPLGGLGKPQQGGGQNVQPDMGLL